jgi:hypothetical protein
MNLNAKGIILATVLLVAIATLMTLSAIDVQAQTQQQFPFISGATTGTSMVNGVIVTGVNTTADNRIIVNLNYEEQGPTPAVTLVATAVDLSPEEFSSLMSTFMGAPDSLNQGNVSLQEQQQSTPLQLPNILTGSNILEEGWTSPSAVTVRLIGNTTTPLQSTNIISVEVSPFTGG